MKKFLQKVWGNLEGWAYIGAKSHDEIGDWRQKTYMYPDQLDTMVKDIEIFNKNASVYFCPHLFKTGAGRRTKEHAEDSRVIWVDKDAGDIADLLPKPTMCWQTSSGRYQAIWVLDEEVDPDLLEIINKRLTHGTKSDKGGWHAGKYLRVPKTLNHKYTPAFVGIMMWDDGPVYSPRDFVPAEGEEIVRDVHELDDTPAPKFTPSFTQALISYGRVIPRIAWELLSEVPRKGVSWSEKLYRLEVSLLKAGVPPEYVFAIAKESPWNKYERDKRPDHHLWKEIVKASSERGVMMPEEDLDELPWTNLDTLLLYAERPTWLVEDVWMAKNVGWIAGEGKSYKSILSLDLALSVASGRPFLDNYRVKDPGTVLMVQEEDPVWRMAHRLQVMSEGKDLYNLHMAENDSGIVLQMKDTDIPLYISIGGRLTFKDEGRMNALERAIHSKRPKLVILDPLFMLAAGMDEFRAGELTEGFLNTLKHWRDSYECAIAVIHHYRKVGDQKAGASETQKIYGSMALYAWSENSLLVSRPDRDLNTVLITRDIKDANVPQKIAVNFYDIDQSYSFELSDRADEVAGRTKHKPIVEVLREDPAGFTMDEIARLSGYGLRTVRAYVEKLEAEGAVKKEGTGRGRELRIVLTPAYKKKMELGSI